MSIKVQPDGMEKAIADILSQVQLNTVSGLEEALNKAGKSASEELKIISPEGKSTKHYKNGWTYKIEGNTSSKKLIIYNKTKPQLTHLLENGHAKVNGGKVEGIPHISIVNDKLQASLPSEIATEVTKQ